jgi:chemotaxis protein methyltransferase CheR
MSSTLGTASHNAAFAVIAAMLKTRSGLIIGADKTYLLETRLAPLMAREKLVGLPAVAARMASSAALEREIIEAMTTNESLFFRDQKPFDALRLRLLPRLAASRPAHQPIRIWSAAASTGQEAYSIAMTAAECPGFKDRKIEILATDLAREPLARARAGIYSQFEIQRGLPMQMLVKYFSKIDGNWRVKPEFRDGISFREWNLLNDPRSLGQFDIVFCRNVLIYFDPDTKTRVLDQIASVLAPDGVLFLGGAETVLGLSNRFISLTGEPGAYTQRRTSLCGLRQSRYPIKTH